MALASEEQSEENEKTRKEGEKGTLKGSPGEEDEQQCGGPGESRGGKSPGQVTLVSHEAQRKRDDEVKKSCKRFESKGKSNNSDGISPP